MNIKFYKYQGTGNDFIMIDDREKLFPSHDKALISKLCDRHFGIGADGLILLQTHTTSDFYMQYFNSDGAESSMCGNGGRCIAAFANSLGIAKEKCQFMAIDGLHEAIINNTQERSWHVELKMCDVGAIKKISADTCELNTGSPHYVAFTSEDLSNIDLIKEARLIRYNDTYKKDGINVNYLNQAENSISIRTYERGVEDETLSCGTGATAAAIAFAHYRLPESKKYTVPVKVQGGNLQVKFEKNDQSYRNIWLCGPAVEVFSGHIKF